MAGLRILIVEARFNDEVADNLVKGAIKELAAVGAGFKRILVPSVFEIPAVIRYAIRAMELRAIDDRYGGYVVLGCAIRDIDTERYEYLARESMRAIQELTLQYSLAVGNGILPCHTLHQALEQSNPDGRNFGGEAARTCLRMIEVKRELRL